MTRISITTIATTNRMWMNPPIVYEETYPSNQKTIKITAIVSSIYLDSFLVTWVCFFVHNGRIHPHSIGRRDRSNTNSCHSGSKTLVATFKKFSPSSPSFLLLVLSSRLIQLEKA